MNSSWIDATLAWIGSHPVLAGIVIFAIAFSDAIIILGAIVPALPLLFAIGVLVGMGEISGPYAVISAALGAFIGDATSYWVGSRWGRGLRKIWPFSRYPQLLDRSENLFRRNAFKSILVARYVGMIRPFVPAIAGIAHMPFRRYALASGIASISWAILFLAPGWLFGQAYEAVAAVAGHLLIIVGLLLAVLVLAWLMILYGYHWFAYHADSMLSRALTWARRHPHLARHTAAVFDPNHRESTSLAMLALLLLAMSWGSFALLIAVVGHGEPLSLDLAIHEMMLALRNPLADYPMAALASLAGWSVLIPPVTLAMGYFIWRKRWMAAAHWLAAIAFGLALTFLLGQTVDVVRPPDASSGFGFPSIAVTMATIVFGFFAILIARELPGRDRTWPYLAAGLIVSVIGFARLYLGAHWFSDIVGGVLFGGAWLLVLGIAYRRRYNRSFWVKPIAVIFYGAFVVAALWYTPRHIDAKLAKFALPPPAVVDADMQHWWNSGWGEQPARRNEFDDALRWPLDVQVAGALEPLQHQLEAEGWKRQPQADWEAALNLFATDISPEEVPILPATLRARAEALLMIKPGATPDECYALRLWQDPTHLQPGDQPLWIGTAQTLRFRHRMKLVGIWLPVRDTDPALEQLVKSVHSLPHVVEPHPESGLPTLRLRVDGRIAVPLSHPALPVPSEQTVQ